VEVKAGIPGVSRIDVLRVPVDVVPEDKLTDVVETVLQKGQQCQIVLIRLWDLMKARRNKEYRNLLHGAGLVIPLSPGIVRGARFLLRSEPVTYLPFDFVVRLLSILEQRNRSLYLLGMERKHLEVVEQNIKQTYPGLRLVGRYHGFYPRYLDESIITAIKKSAPSCLLVGRGVTGGERWIYRHKPRFHSGIFLHAPDVLDIFADLKRRSSRRAPEGGIESLPRLLIKPWRMFRGVVYLWYGLLLLIYRLFQ
jgi:N-acetylglucosaminyldiphosphoundecaprenol N-acetyl-beta-D-mannosaminyltransferase